MRMRRLAADVLEPSRAGEHDVGEAARRLVREQLVANDKVELVERGGDSPGIGIGRQHIDAE
jgi:hypothetical protein